MGRLAPGNQWDQNLLDQLFSNGLYPTGLKFQRFEGYPPHADGCCLIIPSRYWHQHTDQITEAIQRYDWCLAFRVGDEEDLFDPSRVEHPRLKWWIQTPRVGREYPEGSRLFGVGFPPHFNNLPAEPPGKSLEVFLSGQNTHQRRRDAFTALMEASSTWGNDYIGDTDGFTKGLTVEDYSRLMLDAKVAPAPSGAVSPDSFRAWEALEAHCVPLLDDVSPVDGPSDYWRTLFSDSWPIPAPVIADWREAPAIITQTLASWPAIANRVAAFWMRYKRELSIWLRSDLEQLGAL